MPNYSVKMGFGLDQGWAIEGAIGSEFKIDASYLSPHVNLSSRMEAATKQYGVPFLISSNVFSILSPELRKICRKIDVVTVKGSKVPIALYTINISLERLDSRRTIYDLQRHNKSIFANERGNIKKTNGRSTMKSRSSKLSKMSSYDTKNHDSIRSTMKANNFVFPGDYQQNNQKNLFHEETKKRLKLKKRRNKKIDLYEGILEGKIQASKLLDRKSDLRKIIVRDHEFDTLWDEVMICYIGGDWSKAKILLETVRIMRESDGPSLALTNFMKDNNFECPRDWEGFRVLIEK